MIAILDKLAIFWLTFPEEFIKQTIIPTTKIKIKGEPLTLQEFYLWLGCHFFIACVVGKYDMRAWWSTKPISLWEGAPHWLTEFIKRTRFEEISCALCLMDRPPPSFKDGFYLMWQLQDKFIAQ